MLKPQPPGEPGLGRPWNRQRGAADSSRSLARVITEMRDEIRKLEAENRKLRGEEEGVQVPGGAAAPVDPQRRTETEENPYGTGNLRRNASAPALERRLTENTVMTVRRYSTSSNLCTGAGAAREGQSGWGRAQEGTEAGSRCCEDRARGDRRSLQEYVHKTRAKVKTVSFLLPVDDIYTNRPVLTKTQESSSESDS